MRNQLVYIGNRLQKSGFNPTTIDLLTPLLAKKFRVYSASDVRAAWIRLLHMLLTVVRFGKSSSYVLIDVYSTSAFVYFVVVVAMCKVLKLKYIPILHGGNLPEKLNRFPKIRSWSLNGAEKVVSPSLYLRNYLLIHGLDSIYIPNFINLENYKFRYRAKISPRILWVRSFHRIYNPELAVRILSKLKMKYEECQLTMVGPDKDGSMSKVINLAKSLGVEDRLYITGKLDKSQWTNLAASYDLFINTTSVDNMPVSVIEAMALGLPVVSTNVGGIKFMIDDCLNGMLVEPNDVNGFCDKISQIIEDEELKSRIVHNAYDYTRQFDQEVVLSKWFNALQ